MKNSTKVAIAIGVILIVVVGFALAHRSSSAPVSGSINPSGGDVVQSVTTFVPGIVVGAKFIQWQPLVMPVGVNQASWCNPTGQVVLASGARFTLASTTPNGQAIASSTLALSLGTSTKSTITDIPAVWGSLINQARIATSSKAFDNLALVIVGGQTGASVNGTTTFASSTIPVGPGECLNASLENPFQQTGNTAGYSATSSIRGYVLNGLVELSF